MKTNFKNCPRRLFLLGAIGILLLSFTPATAQTDRPAGGTNFCSQNSSVSTRLTKQINNQVVAVGKTQDSKFQTLVNNRNQRDKAILQQRLMSDRELSKRISRLRQRAKTDPQKRAVDAFDQQVSNALSTQRAAIDQAVANYRTSLDEILTQRKTSINQALQSFQNDVQAALQKAKAECLQGLDSKLARQHLLNSLKMAQKKIGPALKFDNQALTDATKNLQALTEQATDDFDQALQKAQSELDTAWKK